MHSDSGDYTWGIPTMPAETMNVDAILERVSMGTSTERDAQRLRSLMDFQSTITKAFELLMDNPQRVRRMFSAQLRRELADRLMVNEGEGR